MKSKFVALVLLIFSMQLHAGSYEDCVMAGMKGVSSDIAARSVNQACRKKDDESKRKRQEKMGSLMKSDEYIFSESNRYENQENNFRSEIFRNLSKYKTITYVALEILDGDYYDFKKSTLNSFYYLEDELNWTNERKSIYFYNILLKPNEEVKLFYRSPNTEKYWSKVIKVLGRESKWSDSISSSVWSDVAKPELTDPLE